MDGDENELADNTLKKKMRNFETRIWVKFQMIH